MPVCRQCGFCRRQCRRPPAGNHRRHRIPHPRTAVTAVGSSITVIDREQIERRESAFAVDLLRDVPGVAISQSGSIGSQTQLRMRGAEANQVLVLIDGIEANDPAGNAEFAFENLGTWDIDRIEVVRGAQSGLWGSDALAGVINVITRQPDENCRSAALVKAAAFDTWSAGTRISGAVLGTRAGLSVSSIDSDGIQQLAHRRRGRWLPETGPQICRCGQRPATISIWTSTAGTPTSTRNSTASTG